jgi:hypothetical protein
MQPTTQFLREQAHLVIEDKRAQGYQVDGLNDELARFYERSLSKLAKRMGKLPRRAMAATGEQASR